MFPSCVSSQGLCRWSWRPGWPREAWVLRAIAPLSRPPGPSRCCGTGSCINESRPRAAPVVFTTLYCVSAVQSSLMESAQPLELVPCRTRWVWLADGSVTSACYRMSDEGSFSSLLYYFSFFNSTVSECICMHFIFYLWFCTLSWCSAVLKAFFNTLFTCLFFWICWNEIKQHNAPSTLM